MAILTGGQFIISFIQVQVEFTTIVRITGVISLVLLLIRAYKTPPIRYGV
jgi:hypothetical protein